MLEYAPTEKKVGNQVNPITELKLYIIFPL